jgi:hypothetical protein
MSDAAVHASPLQDQDAEERIVDGSSVFVVPTRQSARLLDGVQTEVVVQEYADRALVLVTQLGRVGCLVRVALACGPGPTVWDGPLTTFICKATSCIAYDHLTTFDLSAGSAGSRSCNGPHSPSRLAK